MVVVSSNAMYIPRHFICTVSFYCLILFAEIIGMAANASSKTNPPRQRKRVDVETGSLKRASDGSGFIKCDVCNKHIPVALSDMHDCKLEDKIWSNFDASASKEAKQADAQKPPETKKVKKSSPNEKAKRRKKEKKAKDPNQPKKPATAFFVFMDDFRKTFKETNPNVKGGAQVGKEGGLKWSALSEEEKKPYLEKAAELKAEYEKAMSKYQQDLKDDAAKSDGEDGVAKPVCNVDGDDEETNSNGDAEDEEE